MGDVLERQLKSLALGGLNLIDAVATDAEDAQIVHLFFDAAVPVERVRAPEGAEMLATCTVGGCGVMRLRLPPDVAPRFALVGAEHELELAPSDRDAFEGRNALAAVRNGESAAMVLDWLAFHWAQHGMDGAMILDRAQPDAAAHFAAELRAGLEARGLDCVVALLCCAQPLGKPDLPAEAHPFCVPEAPGKDRMDIPPPDRWRSPLGFLSIYELLRARGLGAARAVANVDVHDLIAPSNRPIFDRAVAAEGGLVPLAGRHCYPWRVRKGEEARFGDHICVQFDVVSGNNRWCIAPAKSPADAIWRLIRIGNATPDQDAAWEFHRHMALRHPTQAVSKIVPKTSLVEHPALLKQAEEVWQHKPVRVPEMEMEAPGDSSGRRAIVTTMKNEGPFILEWLAYHRAVGFDDFLVYTNDCTDGTDTLLKLLQEKGYLQHRENPFRQMDMKPQHAALHAAQDEPIISQASWATCIDVDEFVNIKCGDGTLDALFAAVPGANMISMTWRLFGNGDVHLFEEGPIIEQFFRCAPEYARKPHQAWGFKTLFRNLGVFKKLGVHRPKGLNPQLWKKIYWVNGSGQQLPRQMYRNAWRSTIETYGYDLVQLNHYAVRSAESFLVKRDRGRVNHVDRDQGLAYWFRMNNNCEDDRSIMRMVPAMRKELARLLNDPEIAGAHTHSVTCHRAKIDELKAMPNYAKFYTELSSARMEKLSRLHRHFGSNVFLSGPGVIPDEVVGKDPEDEWFFTVELEGETQH